MGSPSQTKTVKNPILYLPVSNVVAYAKGAIIYDAQQPSTSFYLVMNGRVVISRLAEDGHVVVVDVYGQDEFFGESVFAKQNREEQATALVRTELMVWTDRMINDLNVSRPNLAVALIHHLVLRNSAFRQRIEELCVEKMERRLLLTLIRFSERFGTDEGNGTVNLYGFTHNILAQYVGTSRESVTMKLGEFRRLGLLDFSRKTHNKISLNLKALLRFSIENK